MDTKKLRQKILDLAIRGKLVPQDPNDEPASVLLERIRAEKERLIKEGKIKCSKKSASDTPHYENRKVGEANEGPFDIPDSWCWVTFDDVCTLITGSTPSKLHTEYYGGNFPFYKPSDLDAGRHVTISSEYLTEKGKSVSRIIPQGSTSICCIGSIGKCGYIEREGTTNQQINTAVPSQALNPLYLFYFCNSIFFIDKLTADSSAVTISIVNKSKLGKMFISLPPIKEQQRIVSELDKYFALVDDLEEKKGELSDVIKQTKSKILDLGIHGKLVPQDPNDEPAIELLKRINPKFTPCDNAHYPFEIPTTWCLTYVKIIVDNPSCKPFQILQSDINYIGQTPVVSQSSNYIEGYSDRKDCVFKNKNAVLIFGDHTRNLKYVDFDFIVGADGVKIVIPHISVKYSYYALQFIINGMRNRGYARHYSVLTNSTIPVPPLSEQLRIVAKIEELFAVLDEIQKSIEA